MHRDYDESHWLDHDDGKTVSVFAVNGAIHMNTRGRIAIPGFMAFPSHGGSINDEDTASAVCVCARRRAADIR